MYFHYMENDMTDFHYYVSHGLGWKTAPTLEEAIEGAFCTNAYGDMRGWLLNIQKDGKPGIPFFCCRVPLPTTESYSIEWFCPKVEGLTERKNMIVTYVTQKKVAWMRDPDDRIRELEHQIETMDADLAEAIMTDDVREGSK